MTASPSSRVAFSDASDGDIRSNSDARRALARRIGVPEQWATVTQVHGSEVVFAETSGDGGPADALWTVTPELPLAIFTADCFGVVLKSEGATGVAHAGWRGVAAGVVAALRSEMESSGFEVTSAYVGPGIGPCCFEVGSEVISAFPEAESLTSWGTPSVDLRSVIESQVGGIDVRASAACTMHDSGWFSHRADKTPKRMVTLAWL